MLVTAISFPAGAESVSPRLFVSAPPTKSVDESITAELNDDSRLAQRLSLDARRLSAESFAKQLADAANVRITLNRFYDGRDIEIVVRQRTVHELMQSLASLLKGEWTAIPGGYMLRPTPSTLLYQRYWWELFSSERAKALDAIGKSYVDLMNGIDLGSKTHHPPVSRSQPSHEEGIHPDPFWQGLSQAVKESIAGSFNDRYTYRRFPVFTPPSNEGGFVLPVSDVPDASKTALMQSFVALNDKLQTMDIRSIVFSNSDSTLTVDTLLNDGRKTSVGIMLRNPTAAGTASLAVDHRFVKPPAADSGLKLSRTWTKLLAYQQTKVWDNDVPAGTVPDIAPPRLADVLEWLSAKTGREFISDFYSMPCRLMTTAERERKPDALAETELNAIAAKYDVSWKEAPTGITLIAHNRWYRENVLDAPQNLVDDLSRNVVSTSVPAQLDKETATVYKHLATASAITAQFSLWQIANGLCYYVDEDALPPPEKQTGQNAIAANCQPYADICSTCLSYPATLEFFGLLSPEDRADLLMGGLPISRLGAVQRDAAAKVSPDIASAMDSDTTRALRIKLRYMKYGGRFDTHLFFGNINWGNLPYRLSLVTQP